MTCICHTVSGGCRQGRDCPVREAAEGARLAIAADLNIAQLLAKGSIEGPFKAPHPVTRWNHAARCFASALPTAEAMNYTTEFMRAAMRCALRREWRACWMYLRTARACFGKPPF
jgi:hypothetical protein